MATSTHINARRTLLVLVAAASAAAIGTPDDRGYAAQAPGNPIRVVSRIQGNGSSSVPPSYGWPLKPFGQPHRVRAYLNDPRISGSSRSFHFGIDIGVPDKTHVPVYAVQPGTVRIVNAFALMVWGRRTFGYWHVIPSVRAGQYVHKHQLIGVSMGWNHIHFGEYSHGIWINPLRPGGLGPYYDWTIPTLENVTFEHAGRTLDAQHLTGTWSLTLEAFDTAAPIEPAPWPVVPARLRCRITRGGRQITAWHTVLDSTSTMRKSLFSSVYASGTIQNHPGVPGRYLFHLIPSWQSRSLGHGSYEIEIRASDTRSNTIVGRVSFTVGNA
jgi:hypothetical protein